MNEEAPISAKVLLIDDDQALADMLGEYLLPEGWQLDCSGTGDGGLERASGESFDIIVLDVMLPGLSGFDVLKGLRQRGNRTPVLMLTARGDDVDRIVGLELGADDYLPKPFNPRELLARLRAILRRAQPAESSALSYGPWTLDPRALRILEHGVALPLTGAEFRLLEILLSHPGEVVSRHALTQRALGRKLLPLDRSLDTHMSNLRKKLLCGTGGSAIRAVRGEGYVLVDPSPAS